MKSATWRTIGVVVLMSLIAAVPAVTAAQSETEAQQAPTRKDRDAVGACMEMMQWPGMTAEGKEAMEEFMRSDRAPHAMANMMAMARRMGDGDVMLGMTRMMEMMGSMGEQDMMGDGMTQPSRPEDNSGRGSRAR